MNDQPHILHVIDSLVPGGKERMAVEIANATDKSRYRVSVCVTRCDTTLGQYLAPEVRLFRLGRRVRLDWERIKEFSAFCNEKNVDLLHIHGRYSLLFITFVRLCKNPSRPFAIVFHEHYGDVEIHPRMPLSLKFILFLLQPIYVGVHETLSRLARRYAIKDGKVFTIRNAVDFMPYSGPSDLFLNLMPKKVCPLGILVANIRPSKDIILLLRTLAKVKDYPWTMAIVGGFVDPSYRDKCQKLLLELGLEDRIIFMGARLDVPSLIKSADFGVLTSKSESGPLVLIEYLAAGLPFVSTKVGLIGRYLDSLGIPEFVHPGNSDALADGLRRLLCLTPDERKVRGEMGRNRAADYFEIQRVMPLWYEVYDKALASVR